MKINFKFFNYYKKRDRKLDYFLFFQIFLIICLLTVLYSNQTVNRYYRRYNTEKYANITRVKDMPPEMSDEIGLNNYNVLGEINSLSAAKIEGKKMPYNHKICFADKYVFENFKLPLQKGRYPKNCYEALATSSLENYLEINESYKVKIWNNYEITIKIVGFTEGNLSYAQDEQLAVFTGRYYGVSVFVDDFNELANNCDINTDKFIDMSETDFQKIVEDNYKYRAYLSNIRSEYVHYEWKEQPTYHAIACCAYIIIVAVVLVLLTNKVLYQLDKKKEVSIFFISGQSKRSIIIYKLIKNFYYFLWVLFISLFIVIMIVNFLAEFYLSYKAWGIAISYCLIVVCFINFINAKIIKKQNICETINTVS